MRVWSGIRDWAHNVAHRFARMVPQHRPVQPAGAGMMVKDSLLIGRTAAQWGSPGFNEALRAVSLHLQKNGNFADATAALLKALDASTVTEEALEVSRIATRLATRFHPDNRLAIPPSFRRATELAQSAPEAFGVIKGIVKTRQEAYALFHLDDRHDVLRDAVAKWADRDGRQGKELAREAFKLVKFSEFAKSSERQAIHRISVMETREEWVTAISNYLRKALD